MKQLGLIVNPMAGIGGKVGLKGSDGEEIRKLAFSLGAKQEAPDKVIRALKRMAEAGHDVHIITCPGKMGEDEAKAAGYDPEIIDGIATEITSADDTKKAAEILMERGVDLLMFAGGDGTARDVCSVIGTDIPAVGIPADNVCIADLGDCVEVCESHIKKIGVVPSGKLQSPKSMRLFPNDEAAPWTCQFPTSAAFVGISYEKFSFVVTPSTLHPRAMSSLVVWT